MSIRARLGVVLALVVAVALVLARTDRLGGEGELARGLARRGRVAVVSARAWKPAAADTEFVPVNGDGPLRAALAGMDAQRVADAMREAHLDGVLMDVRHLPAWATPESVGGQLARHALVEPLVGRYLAADAALYAPDPVAVIPKAHRQALAIVARRMLAGERPPRIQSFPAGLRAVAHVEVMVLLKSGPRPRLWRSARGSSIARAFLTAVRVARARWNEREQAMGAPLDEALPRLSVEVSLLQDDGEIGTRRADFIDRVVTDEHGVAYDRKGAWRYLLPEATREQGHGSASAAFERLLLDHALAADDLERSEVRPYRLRVRQLAISPAPRPNGDGLDPLEDPDELLGLEPQQDAAVD